ILNKDAKDPSERYHVKYVLVNAADYGVPQVRWRVFVVAFRQDLGLEDWEFPRPTHSEASLLLAQAKGSYWDEHPVAARHRYAPSATPPLFDHEEQPERWRTL